jgi:hypothetical protein
MRSASACFFPSAFSWGVRPNECGAWVWHFLFGANVEFPTRLLAFDHDRRSGCRALAGSFRLVVLRAVDDAGLGLVTVERVGLGYAHRLLSGLVRLLYSNLHQRSDLAAETVPVCALCGICEFSQKRWAKTKPCP